MAILVYKDGGREYRSGTGVVTDTDKLKADRLDRELSDGFSGLESKLLADGYLQKEGKKNDALRVWYLVGQFLNEVADKYSIIGTSDEQFFWEAIYHYASPTLQKGRPPVSMNTTRNHFKRCAFMAQYDFGFVKGVGNWSMWRDLLDNSKLYEDQRVFDWVIENIHNTGLGHKQVRPFIHEVRRAIKNKDTKFITDEELLAKLKPFARLLPE